jgi:SAM-dependent methyltransferase
VYPETLTATTIWYSRAGPRRFARQGPLQSFLERIDGFASLTPNASDQPKAHEPYVMTANTIYGDGTYLQQNPGWHQEDSAWKAMHVQKMLGKHRITPKSVCEVGCGAGAILDHLASTYGESVCFTGYDISPQAIEICRPKERSNLHFRCEDLIEDNSAAFEVVLALDVVEHVEDYLGFLRALRPRGHYKIFHFPLDLSVQAIVRSGRLMEARQSVGHLHYFSKETALATLRDTGYEILDFVYTAGSLDLGHHEWKARAMKLPRRLLFQVSPDLAARLFGGFSLLILAT